MFVKGMLTAVALTAGISGHAMAQSTEVVTGNGQTAVVPDAATASKGVSPVATQVVSPYPAFNQSMNNDSIANTLLSQGFQNIHILREGSLMTITATRDSKDVNLVYNLVEGRLIKVNGERILSEEESSLRSGGEVTRTESDDGMSGVGTDDNSGSSGDTGDGATDGTGSDDGAAGDDGSSDDGAGTGTGDGSGSDTGGTGSDGGSGTDGGTGSDGGSSGDGGSSSDGGSGGEGGSGSDGASG